MKILLVSNHNCCSDIIGMFNDNTTVIHATSCHEALFHLDQNWDAVLLDIELENNKQNAIDVIKSAKANNPSNEFIVFTTDEDSEKCIEALKHGAQYYFHYPFKRTELMSIVRSLIISQEALEKSISNTLTGQFLDMDPALLLKTLLENREKKNEAVTQDEFNAFYPPHLRRNKALRDALKTKLSEDQFNILKKCPPPTVLVVEDEDNVRKCLVEILLDAGYNVLEAADGFKAEEIAKDSQNIDINLLDIGLPGRTGIELIPILKEINPSAQTIMLTAFNNNTDYIIDAFKNNVYDYLTKPYEEQNVLLKISEALQQKSILSIIPDLSANLLSQNMSSMTKYRVLNEISRKKQYHNDQLKMKDITQFFPKLDAANIPAETVIPDDVIEDGLLLFIEILRQEIDKGNEGMDVIKHWEAFL